MKQTITIDNEGRYNMGAPEGSVFTVYLDKDGRVISGEKTNGGVLEYNAEEAEVGMNIKGAYLHTSSSPQCCWRVVAGVWKCRYRYCI